MIGSKNGTNILDGGQLSVKTTCTFKKGNVRFEIGFQWVAISLFLEIQPNSTECC